MRTNAAFWDSSAILPLCYSQRFSRLANKERQRFKQMVAWWGTTVEIHSGIARLKREGLINERQTLLCLRRWKALNRGAQTMDPTDYVLELATEMPESHALRVMDAFQLAAALVWCGERPRNRPFITADNRLGEAASDAGFDVVSLA